MTVNKKSTSSNDISSKLREYVHKEMHKKNMRNMFKTIHRMRVVINMSQEQKKQVIMGMGFGFHMVKKMKRVTHLQNSFQNIFLLVFVPFMIPPAVVLGLPLLLLALPILCFGMTFSMLNAKKEERLRLNKRKVEPLKRSDTFRKLRSGLQKRMSTKSLPKRSISFRAGGTKEDLKSNASEEPSLASTSITGGTNDDRSCGLGPRELSDSEPQTISPMENDFSKKSKRRFLPKRRVTFTFTSRSSVRSSQ